MKKRTMRLIKFLSLTAILAFLLTACASPASNTQNNHLSKEAQASVITPLFSEFQALTKDEIRNQAFEKLENTRAEFEKLLETYLAFPVLQESGEPVVPIHNYYLSQNERLIKFKGNLREKASAPESDVNLLVNHFKTKFPEAEFSFEKNSKEIEITGVLRQKRINEIMEENFGELSEIKKLQLENAIPDFRNDGLFLQTLADLTENLGLSVHFIAENPPLEIDEPHIERFQVTIELSGFMKDIFRFIAELPKLSRKTQLISAAITRADIRDAIEIGKASLILETYYLENP